MREEKVTNNMMNNIKKLIKNPYFVLNVIIIVIGFSIYAPFIFGNWVYAYSDWGYDTKHSYLAIYEYYVNRIQCLQRSFYDFSHGLGTNIFPILSFACDPFGLFIIVGGVVFGKGCVPQLLIFAFLLKNIALGNIGLRFLKMFHLSNKSAILAATVLSFCGYMMITGQHYMFATYAVLYMLSILMLEHYIRHEKHWLGLVMIVAWQGIIGPYYLFQSLIGLAIYCIVRYCWIENSVKLVIYKLVKILGYVVLGVAISMFSFLPQCYEILVVSNRIGEQQSLFQKMIESIAILPVSVLKSGFLRLYSANLEGLINNWEGVTPYFSQTPYCFSVFLVYGIIYQWNKTYKGGFSLKEKVIRILIFVLAIFVTCCTFIPALTNAFSYISFRFAFIIIPLELWCVADSLNDLFCSNKVHPGFCWPIMFFSTLMLCILSNTTDIIVKYNLWVVLGAVFAVPTIISLLYCTSSVKMRRSLYAAMFLVLVLPIMCDSVISLYCDRSIMKKNQINAYLMPEFEYFLKSIQEREGDNFYRVERDYLGYDGSPDTTFSFICPTRTLSSYNSTLSGFVGRFCANMIGTDVLSHVSYANGSYGMCFDNQIACMLGLKYIVSREKREHEDWILLDEYKGYYLYLNNNLETAGGLYDAYITEDEYQSLDEEVKSELLSGVLVLEDKVIEDKLHYDLTQKNVDIERFSNDMSVCNENMGDKITIRTNNKEDKWLYCPIVYDRNWKVYVNGKLADTYIANYGFIAVPLVAGENVIVFTYSNTQFFIGCIVSIVSVIIALFKSLLQRKNEKGNEIR